MRGRGGELGCKEALFTLGDRPEARWDEARQWLDERGYDSTLDYVRAMAIRVLEETGLLPHLNPGVMSWSELSRLKPVAPSMGMMLETTSRRLFETKGEAHYGSPDKDPEVRLRTFADAGYDCGLIGKLHLASASQGIEPRADDGYRYWEYSHAPRDDWPEGHGYADWVRAKGKILGDLVPDPEGVPTEYHQTTWCADKTIEFMAEKRDAPWLASVNIYDPHPPFNAPREYRDLFDPQDMPGPLFRESDLAEQERLSFADFQSKGRHPEELTWKNRYYSEEKDAPWAPSDARTQRAKT